MEGLVERAAVVMAMEGSQYCPGVRVMEAIVTR